MNDDKNVKELRRSLQNRKVCGVCGGIGEYLKIDPTVVRLIWVLVSLASCGTGLLAYIIAAIVMPESNEVY
jgi:phage shock protein PspC (stress-responsive transcriptional regulator)